MDHAFDPGLLWWSGQQRACKQAMSHEKRPQKQHCSSETRLSSSPKARCGAQKGRGQHYLRAAAARLTHNRMNVHGRIGLFENPRLFLRTDRLKGQRVIELWTGPQAAHFGRRTILSHADEGRDAKAAALATTPRVDRGSFDPARASLALVGPGEIAAQLSSRYRFGCREAKRLTLRVTVSRLPPRASEPPLAI